MSSSNEGQQGSSILRRRQLANELRRLREEAKITISEVSSKLYCSPSKISRMETARVSVSIPDVTAMLQLYKVHEAKREALIQLAVDAKRKEDWWHARGDVPESNIREFIDLEAAASVICVWESLLIPGLLQMPEYTRSILREHYPDRPSVEVERIVELRPMRQSILARNNPPELRAVFDQAALERLVGPLRLPRKERHQDIYVREQLQRIRDTAKLRNVSIRMIPATAGPHPGMTGAFTILEFPEVIDLDIVHFENIAGDLYVDRQDQVHRYKRLFVLLEEKALTHDDTIEWITGLSRELGDEA